MAPDHRSLIIILGPTGVGKSALAIHLARRFGGEIISCDSMQVYRGFDIGTDKPSPADRQDIRHHLIDIADPATQFTAADFVRESLSAIRLIQKGGNVPFVVGGTGLYLKALLEGLFPGPGRDPLLRSRLEAQARTEGIETLHLRLKTVDPAYARMISPRDRVRIIRALEVFELTGTPLSRHFQDTSSPVAGFHCLKIGLKLEREILYKRIEDRVEKMFRRGLVEETRRLLDQGVAADSPPFRALGYQPVLRFLEGTISLEEAMDRVKKDTRHYAKRQMTWFRKMSGVRWFAPSERDAIVAAVAAHLGM